MDPLDFTSASVHSFAKATVSDPELVDEDLDLDELGGSKQRLEIPCSLCMCATFCKSLVRCL